MTTRLTVEVQDVTLKYRSKYALSNVSFSLQAGVTGLLGPNGAGKSTLLRILATAAAPDSGALTILGLDPDRSSERLAIRRQLGYLPQQPGFYPHFTVFEFVDYLAILKEMTDRRQRHGEVRRVLEQVGLSSERGKRIKTLSGGMRQRVALATAILGSPQLLILDEPTVGLDPAQRLRFRELVAGLGEGRIVLLSTHQTEDVAALCNRVIVLDNGRVKYEGNPDGLAETARGHVWHSTMRDPQALAAWRTGTGLTRNIGTPPEGAQLTDPTIEDGYLMLLDSLPTAEVAA